MDLATVIGVVAAFGLVLFGIMIGGTLTSFLNAPGALIVIGGTLGATLVSHPMSQVLNLGKVLKNALFNEGVEPKQTIDLLLEFAQTVRKEGVLALEDRVEALEDPFMKKGLQMAIDGQEPEVVEAVLQNEVTKMEDRHDTGASILDTMGTLSPAFGMIGTLIGLVQMLGSLEDPSTIGPAMAVALLTTLYGTMMANMVWTPLAAKLERNSNQESTINNIYLVGTVSIGRQENPRRLEMLLNSLLSPQKRVQYFD